MRGSVVSIGLFTALCSGGLASIGLADVEETKAAVGWFDLQERIGSENMPTGATVKVLQCEASVGANGWRPEIDNNTLYGGKTFNIPFGSPVASAHANAVGSICYGLTTSIAPGVSEIWLYEASSFIQSGYLNTGTSAAPDEPQDDALRVHNHSWVGQFNNTNDFNALRRLDYAIIRDNTFVVNGTLNGGQSQHLFAHAFNSLTVGILGGGHSTNDVPSGIDGIGRMKPEIVAPGTATSYTTPVVSAAAALMYEVIDTDPVLSASVLNYRQPIMKAAFLAGATHPEGWTNNPTDGSTARPIDNVSGAGLLNVDRIHRILTGYRQIGTSSLESTVTVTETGFDYTRITSGDKWWKFSVESKLDEFVAALTWPRVPGSTFTNYTLMDLDLELVRVVDGVPESLVGSAGVDAYESGNVRSESSVDNIELLVVNGLEPGEYALKASRMNAGQSTYAGLAWIMIQGEPDGIPGDLDGDGFVNGADLTILLGAWGTDSLIADLDEDGLVTGSDLTILLSNWSTGP